jgi:hypothetical protein
MARKTAEPVAEIEPVAATAPPYALPAIEPDDDGYYHDAHWLTVACDWDSLKPRAGFKPLAAEIDVSLTFAEAMAIPDPFHTPFSELAPHVCPRVRAWNARMRDPETGKAVPAPPPAEAGVAAFRDVKPGIMAWLAFTLKTVHLGGGPNRGNATPPSGGGSDGPSDDA